MAQEYHNYIDLLGSQGERQQFVADALRLCPKWGWDWVKIGFNDQASLALDSGRSHLDFYTHGFPHGLDDLMGLYPNVVLDGHFFDMTAPCIRHITLRNKVVLKESDEDVEWVEESEEQSAGEYRRAIRGLRKDDQWALAEKYLEDYYDELIWCALMYDSAYQRGCPKLLWRKRLIVEVLDDPEWEVREKEITTSKQVELHLISWAQEFLQDKVIRFVDQVEEAHAVEGLLQRVTPAIKSRLLRALHDNSAFGELKGDIVRLWDDENQKRQ